MKPHILFTGGGTFGHVGANLALIQNLPTDWKASYIGSKNSIEEKLVSKKHIPFYAIASGKLRRYFSLKNATDIFRILTGIIQAYFIVRKERPSLIFSKGGYVAFPVVIAGWLNRIPVIIHESDLTPGLTTRLTQHFAKCICVNFDISLTHFKSSLPVKVTGLPIRNELLNGDAQKGRTHCQLNSEHPILLVFGGSLGSTFLNNLIQKSVHQLCRNYQVIHVVGPNNKTTITHPNYRQFEYLDDEFPHIIAAADIVCCRGGASSLTELIGLQKPHVIIPLSQKASRGDQLENAAYFKSLGISTVLPEQDATPESLPNAIQTTLQNQKNIIYAMQKFAPHHATKIILSEFKKFC